MSDKDKPLDEDMAAAADAAKDMASELAANDDMASDEAAPDFAADADPVEQLMNENGELKDQLLRALAEAENVRRRSERQVREANIYSVSGFARDMLTIGDNLQRTLEAVPEEAKSETNMASMLEGVELTMRELKNTLEKHGVKEISPKGEKFDPNFHQAMFEVQNPDAPANSIIEVVQNGYVIGERVLRPAMVGVAKGGPKFETAPVDDEPETEEADAIGSAEAAARTDEAQSEASKSKDPPVGSRVDKSA